jgi:hypothetical protein
MDDKLLDSQAGKLQFTGTKAPFGQHFIPLVGCAFTQL